MAVTSAMGTRQTPRRSLLSPSSLRCTFLLIHTHASLLHTHASLLHTHARLLHTHARLLHTHARLMKVGSTRHNSFGDGFCLAGMPNPANLSCMALLYFLSVPPLCCCNSCTSACMAAVIPPLLQYRALLSIKTVYHKKKKMKVVHSPCCWSNFKR